jgi:predicted outer membrane repeat protein
MSKFIKSILFISVILFILICFSPVHAENVTDVNSTEPAQSYSNLTSKITGLEDKSTLNLTESYRFDNSTDADLINGVIISKNLTIKGSNNSFIDGANTARGFFIESYCSVIFENLIFRNCYSNCSGAGIYLSDFSSLIIKNCTFMNNAVYNSDGGAINAQEGTNLQIYNSIFDNNTSIRESDIVWSKFKAGMGSAIYLRYNSTLEIFESIFRNNIAYMSTIIVVSNINSVFKLSTLKVKDCLFENNTSRECGVIYSDELGAGEILDSIFKNNVFTYAGAALELDTCTNFLVKNCLFENNSGISGGAIKVKIVKTTYLAYVTISNCNFTKNAATKNGGAICTQYAVLTISNCNFNQNAAAKDGGAIYTEQGSTKISNCNFNKNTANNGGAISLASEGSSISSCSFTKNVANSKGGAIYSVIEVVKNSKLTYTSNKAAVSTQVFGAYYAKVKQYTYTNNRVKLKIKLTSPWSMPVSQQIKITVKGAKSYTSNWLKANSNGIVNLIVPFTMNINKYQLSIEMKKGVCFVKSWTKVKDTAKIIIAKKKVKKPTKIQLTIKNKASKKIIKNTKFTVKIKTGKKFKTYKLKTNKKGILKINTKKITRGLHKVVVILSNSNYNINNKFYVRIK